MIAWFSTAPDVCAIHRRWIAGTIDGPTHTEAIQALRTLVDERQALIDEITATRQRNSGNAERLRSNGLVIFDIGGACPAQGRGLICGWPWYFRARHGEWELTVADDPVGVSIHADVAHIESKAVLYLHGDDDTEGWMEIGDILPILYKAWADLGVRIYRGELKNGPGIVPGDWQPR